LWPFGIGILWPFGIFCGHLVYVVAIWYILWPFGIFCGHLAYFMVIFPVLVCCPKKNLATLILCVCKAGLTDGLFSNKKTNMGHREYWTDIRDIL
jgi:hypothetical protein